MNRVKAEYFDTMAMAPWAVDPFPAEDQPKPTRLLVVHFANADAINEIHRTAAAPIRQDRLPPPVEMRRLFVEAGLIVDWCTDDPLGYLVRGIRPAGPAPSLSPDAH